MCGVWSTYHGGLVSVPIMAVVMLVPVLCCFGHRALMTVPVLSVLVVPTGCGVARARACGPLPPLSALHLCTRRAGGYGIVLSWR